MSWIDEKTKILQELGRYITLCSQMEPLPLEYIANLQRIKAILSTANEAEFAPYPEWWDNVRSDWL